MQSDTISAIATAAGEGGIGIVRISGPEAAAIAQRIFRIKSGKAVAEIETHRAVYGTVVEPETEEAVDEGLLLVMRAPRSYTREDVVEIQCHGGMTPLRKILALALGAGARLAEPGEFTKRAFLNGRLDLTQAKAVMDVIRSKTDRSLKAATRCLGGALSKKIGQVRGEILAAVAHLEAAIDFPEDDIAELAPERFHADVLAAKDKIGDLLATARTGRILRDGLETAIVGRPNVGKSSLLNALLDENRAIVADLPGTTRDAIEEYINIDGIPLKIVDTAGIRETEDFVERIGVDRARAYIERADLVLLLLDGSETLQPEDLEILRLARDKDVVAVVNKSDLPQTLDIDNLRSERPGLAVVELSAATGEGIAALKKEVARLALCTHAAEDGGAYVNHVRQVALLQEAEFHLAEALDAAERGIPPDFLTIDLKIAWEKLGEITGETVSEDIVDRIFKDFCIGK